MVTKQLLINYDSVYQNNDRHAIIKDLTDPVCSTSWGLINYKNKKYLFFNLFCNSTKFPIKIVTEKKNSIFTECLIIFG
jgi:hypothetical protein